MRRSSDLSCCTTTQTDPPGEAVPGLKRAAPGTGTDYLLHPCLKQLYRFTSALPCLHTQRSEVLAENKGRDSENCSAFLVISEVGGVRKRVGDFGRNWTERL